MLPDDGSDDWDRKHEPNISQIIENNTVNTLSTSETQAARSEDL